MKEEIETTETELSEVPGVKRAYNLLIQTFTVNEVTQEDGLNAMIFLISSIGHKLYPNAIEEFAHKVAKSIIYGLRPPK